MADHTDNGLRAVIKALTDVIAPAIDPADPLAREQLRLAVDYLEFVRGHLDLLYGRERLELRQAVELAEDLITVAELDDRTRLEVAAVHGRTVLETAGSAPATLRVAAATLAAVVRDIVRGVGTKQESVRRVVEGKVLAHASERIRFERSWYLPLGFDPTPGTVDDLAALLTPPEPTRR